MIIAIILIQIPLLGNYFRVINTVIHESGHALISLFGGKVERISLFMNSEGATYGSQSTRIGSIFTSLAGYIFSSFMAFISFWLLRKNKLTILIDILLGFIFLNLIFWVRNPYGLFWLVSFAFLFLLLLIKGSRTIVNHVLLLIASILLVDSIKSAFEILLLSFIQPNSAGDASNLAQITAFIPTQIWGAFFFIQSLWFPFIGIKRGIFRIVSRER
ncbi:M50 family metallopeptidase [Neobacillus sp. PS3-40]|uniref:M50 family metallopeptidase n=1 Tax=Neobacillus sp. PS3-40 TaxID=3070679 RepID=UPI0027E079FB|nr:M50 family metallopeptidase [Neobacillus sp. PS3-40]WML46363.1 M50 family metallopeptidase [Neobacillus sp. PS3-40]